MSQLSHNKGRPNRKAIHVADGGISKIFFLCCTIILSCLQNSHMRALFALSNSYFWKQLDRHEHWTDLRHLIEMFCYKIPQRFAEHSENW